MNDGIFPLVLAYIEEFCINDNNTDFDFKNYVKCVKKYKENPEEYKTNEEYNLSAQSLSDLFVTNKHIKYIKELTQPFDLGFIIYVEDDDRIIPKSVIHYFEVFNKDVALKCAKKYNENPEGYITN